MRRSLVDSHLVVEVDDLVLGTGLSRQRVVGPPDLDVARGRLRHLEDCQLAGVLVTEESHEAVQEAELPVDRMTPAAGVHHHQGGVELVVECPGDLILPHRHHQGVLLGLASAVRSNHLEVVDADIILERQGQYLLSAGLECCPFQSVNICSSVSVNDPQTEIPRVSVFQILKRVGGNDNSK